MYNISFQTQNLRTRKDGHNEMSKPGEKQIALIPDKIYLGNPLDKNSGFDWPGVMRLSLGSLRAS